MLVLTSAGAALLTGLVSFPIIMSGPVAADEARPLQETPATSPAVPVRLPWRQDVTPDDEGQPDAKCVCQLALPLTD